MLKHLAHPHNKALSEPHGISGISCISLGAPSENLLDSWGYQRVHEQGSVFMCVYVGGSVLGTAMTAQFSFRDTHTQFRNTPASKRAYSLMWKSTR